MTGIDVCVGRMYSFQLSNLSFPHSRRKEGIACWALESAGLKSIISSPPPTSPGIFTIAGGGWWAARFTISEAWWEGVSSLLMKSESRLSYNILYVKSC